MKMKIYDVYVDDGKDVFKIVIPAESQKKAEQYVMGNGEIIKSRLNPDIQNIDINCLADTLKRNDWGQEEINIITRCLSQCGLERL